MSRLNLWYLPPAFFLQAGHGCGQRPAFPVPSVREGNRTASLGRGQRAARSQMIESSKACRNGANRKGASGERAFSAAFAASAQNLRANGRMSDGAMGGAGQKLERAKGFEPSTPTLARSCSTTELHPHPC